MSSVDLDGKFDLLTLTKQTQLSRDLCGFLLCPLFPIAFFLVLFFNHSETILGDQTEL